MNLIKKTLKYCLGILSLCGFKLFKIPSIKNADIIFFFPYYHLGGAEKVHLEIVQSVAHKKVTIIFTQGSATNHYKEQFENLATVIELNHIINKKNKWVNRVLLTWIARSINNSSTILKVLGSNTNYYYQIIPRIKKPCIDLIHAFAPQDERELMLVAASPFLSSRIVINQKAQQVLNSYYTKHDLSSDLFSKIHIISNGVTLPKETSFHQNEHLKIGFIGRWSDEKRPELFLKLSKTYKSSNPETEFVIAGSNLKSNKNLIEQSGVKILGSLKGEKAMNSLYRSLDCIIITSTYEGFPMVLMECMTYGVIPICTNVGGISEHVKHQQTGFLIDEKEPELIINKMTEYLSLLESQPSLHKQMSTNVKEYAVKHFSIDSFYKSYGNLLS